MLKRILVIVTIINAIFFISCEKTLNTDISGGKNELVVNATLCPDSTISIVLCKSKNVLDETGIEYINNANIYVYEYNILIDTLKNKGNGFYMGNIKPTINRAYTIKVKTTGNGIAEATDSIPEMVKIQKIDTSVVINTSSKLLNCTINITDPVNNDNFYLFRILSANEANPRNVQMQAYACLDPMIIDADVVGTLAGGNIFFFDDTKFNGKTHSLVVSMLYPKNKIVYFQLWSISKTFYNYCFSIAFNRGNDASLFSERTQVKGNIKGGVGIMGAYSISADSIVVE